ncbi:sodium channel protein Nach-like [Polistes fuscatus]|uniref:sodium channel protein Nach-like n=1 Tax=Polistes fuscatus TaxID=30207 RepID=UPI001CA9F769|nr:sodium channel protein Nach-like [Polistes fuscatus]
MLANTIKKLWHTLIEVYNEFSIESTIHGIKHTTHAKSISLRILWIIIIILSFLASAKLAMLFYSRHQLANMSTLIISPQVPTNIIPLPAVTLCHGNIATIQNVLSYLSSQERIYIPRGLTRDDFEHSVRYLREAIYPKNHYPEELDKLQQILTANQLSLSELFENISPNCTDFVMMCRLNGIFMPCDKMLNRIITRYGVCCAFNYEDPRKNIERSKEESLPNYSLNFGSRYVMSFLMKPLPPRDRMSSIINGDGMKILIHEKYTYPESTAFQFIAASGQEIIAKLYPTALSSSSEILNLPTTVRGCYMALSSQKNHRYRADNCYTHCRETITRKICGCIPFSASVLETKTDLKICNLTHISCLARITLQTYTLTLQDSECDCLPDCESISYKVAVNKLPMSAIQYSPGKFYEAAARISNATILHVTFARNSAILQRRELVLSWINLISSLGGVFSLFLGCSFISLVEIFYFFCVHFFYKLKFQRESLNSNSNMNKNYN